MTAQETASERGETLEQSAQRLFGVPYGRLTTEQLVALVADRRARKRAAALRPPFTDSPAGDAS